MGGYAIGQKQQNNSQARQYGVFVGLAPGLSCPWQHCCIAAHLWVVQLKVDMFFSFWSSGLLVSVLVSMLLSQWQGWGVLVCPCTFYAYRSLKTNIVVTILFQRHFTRLRPFVGYEPCCCSDGWTIHYIVALSERTSSAPSASAIVFPLRFWGAGFVCLVDAQVQPSHRR